MTRKTMTLGRLVGVVAVLVLMAGCASTGQVGGGLGSANGTPGATGTSGQTVYDTRGVADTYGYQPGQTPQGKIVGGPGTPRAQRTVYFDFDSSEIPSSGRPVIAAQARYLQDHTSTVVTLEGNTDERGTREYNIGLGYRRANAVRDALIASGVSPNQIKTLSYGEERPVAFCHQESCWRLNRRVEFAY